MGNCCGKSREYTLPPQVDDTPIVKNNASVRKSKAILDLSPINTKKEIKKSSSKRSSKSSSSSSKEEEDQKSPLPAIVMVNYDQSPKIVDQKNQTFVYSEINDSLEIQPTPNEGKSIQNLTKYLMIANYLKHPAL